MWLATMRATSFVSNEFAYPFARDRRVIGDNRKAGFALAHEFVEQPFRRSDTHEAADHHARTLGDHGDRLFDRDGFHATSSPTCPHGPPEPSTRTMARGMINLP